MNKKTIADYPGFSALLDLTKPMQTVSGLPVRILCTDARGKFPVKGLVRQHEMDIWFSWNNLGRCEVAGYIYNLVPVPPKPITKEQVFLLSRNNKTGKVCIIREGEWLTGIGMEIIGRKTLTITEGEGM